MELNMSVGPTLPDEAKSAGALNASPESQRKPKGTQPKTNGPKVRDNGSYAPAEYSIGDGMVRRDR